MHIVSVFLVDRVIRILTCVHKYSLYCILWTQKLNFLIIFRCIYSKLFNLYKNVCLFGCHAKMYFTDYNMIVNMLNYVKLNQCIILKKNVEVQSFYFN